TTDGDELATSFAEYFMQWVDDRAPRWISNYDDAAGALVAAEETNLRAAGSLLPPPARLRLAACTYATYYQLGRLTEGRRMLEDALVTSVGDQYWTAFALGGVSACAFRLGDLQPAADAGRR